MYVISVMSLLISAALLLLGLMFFCCAFVPASKCRTMGQGGLPAVLITSGKPHRREGTTPITFHLKIILYSYNAIKFCRSISGLLSGYIISSCWSASYRWWPDVWLELLLTTRKPCTNMVAGYWNNHNSLPPSLKLLHSQHYCLFSQPIYGLV